MTIRELVDGVGALAEDVGDMYRTLAFALFNPDQWMDLELGYVFVSLLIYGFILGKIGRLVEVAHGKIRGFLGKITHYLKSRK